MILFLGGIIVYLGCIKEEPGLTSSQPEQTKLEAVRVAERVIVKSNRSIILGKVEKVERNFPNVKLTIEVVKSQSVEDYANFIKRGQIIEIQPNYFGKGFGSPSFFEDKRNIINLQGYYFLPGDYFIAEVSLWGDEKRRVFIYFNILRVNEEVLSREVKNLEEFLVRIEEGEEDIIESPWKPLKRVKKLDSLLYRLTLVSDPEKFAQQHSLYLSANKVRVIIELAPDHQKIEGEYELTVEGIYKNLIQALVPVKQLIPLSEDPSVQFVRPLARPLPLSTSEEERINQGGNQ